jgi:hypothetical protein
VSPSEEISSPELVLVSPPEVAAQAREALPDYEVEFERWVVETRAAFSAEAARAHEPPERLTLGALAFTALSVVACATPLVLLLLSRSL